MLSLFGTLAVLLIAAPPEDDTFFETKIRPVLAGTCVRCHGPEKASGGLRLDSRAALVTGGDRGPAVEPEDSLLLAAVKRTDELPAMPPDKALPADVVADLERWVAGGSRWPDSLATIRAERHWAFEPIKNPTPPILPGIVPQSPIDSFLLASAKTRGLIPVGPADKRTLIRRATFDLTGLPPTPEEVEAFVNDGDPAAFSKVVDRLLASPRYGEKWGRAWLDVVRYADTAGETADMPVLDAWRYRNYVIDAFNDDMPYDQFLREQIAGDLLAADLPADAPAGRYAAMVTATGYLALGPPVRVRHAQGSLPDDRRHDRHPRQEHARPHDRLRPLPRS